MNEIRKSEGFKHESILVFPRDFLKSVAAHPLGKALYPTDVGFFPDAQYHYRERPNGCGENILVFNIGGRGFVSVGGKKKAVGKDTLFIIPEGTPHIYASDEKQPWSIFWVHFKGENAAHYLESLDIENLVVSLTPQKSSRLRLLFDEILNYLRFGYSIDSMLYVSGILSNLLSLVFYANDSFRSEKNSTTAPVERSIVYMTEHIAENITLGDLANHESLSISQFSSIFRKKVGFSPIDYLLRLRVHRACEHLDTTDTKVSEIAKCVGFSDPFYFSRAFSKIMGLSPSEYRGIKKG